MISRVTITYKKSPKVMKKYLNKMVQEATSKTGKAWLEDYFPLRFTEGAVGRYNFVPRTAKYNREKMRKYGHQKHLVFSGDMKRYFDTTMPVESSTPRRFRLSWKNVPKQVAMSNRTMAVSEVDAFIINYPKNNMYDIQQELKKNFDLDMSMGTISQIRKGLGRSGRRKMPNLRREITTLNLSELKDLNKKTKKEITKLTNLSDTQKKLRYK